MRVVSVITRSFVDFFRDGGMMLAASISFFSMLAIVPFCIFLVTIFSHFLVQEKEFYQFFLSKLVSYFPSVTQGITDELTRLIIYKGIGHFSLALYGFLSYELFSALEAATNTIFKIKVKRSFIVSLILSLVLITSISAFFIVSFAATSSISMLKPVQELFPGLQFSWITEFVIGYFIPFILMFATVATLFILLPKKAVKVRHAISGALFTAVFLEIAKHLFTLYILNVFQLGTIYGPLSAFVIFLLWVYYSASIFLVGAEIVHNLGTA